MLIDVIIPVYNAQKYIDKCLNSLSKQSIKDKCLITIIDDGSTESYDKILSLYNDLNINYIKYKKNMGVGYARKEAMRKTNKEYIIFIDSDDYFLDDKALEKMLLAMENYNMVVALESMDNKKLIHYGNLHAKMYRRSIIKKKKIKFSLDLYNEDLVFNIKYLFSLDATTIHYIDDLVYFWSKVNNNSLSQKYKMEMIEKSIVDVINLKKYFIKTKNYQLKKIFGNNIIDCINKLYNNKYCNMEYYEVFVFLKKVCQIIKIFENVSLNIKLDERLVNNLKIIIN